MNNQTKGAVYMILSAFAFAFMQAMIAKTADVIPLFEQLFLRNFIAAIIAYISIYREKLPVFGTKGNRKLLWARSLTGYFGMITLFYASSRASQGDVAIILKMSPFVVTIAAVMFLGEKATRYEIIALLVAFVGAFFVANPEFNSNVFPLIVAFVSCVFAGLAYTFVSALKGREHPKVIIFFFSMVSTVITFPIMLQDFVMPDLKYGVMLLSIGVSAAIGQLALTYSYAMSKASEVSIYNYSGIIFSMLLGYMMLGQSMIFTSLIGGALVIGAGCLAFFGNRHLEHKQNTHAL
ncbi:DMT family transporter [Chakrabartyella piscis]|uniref:DMT family transporter n=1 Tax=Chakrabartyella piscis TaxID=2918914 RepID=UPI002958A9AC|nr:DMT family transporter [Chakrabartyella piscis]